MQLGGKAEITALRYLTEQADRKSNSIFTGVSYFEQAVIREKAGTCMVDRERAMVTDVDKTPF